MHKHMHAHTHKNKADLTFSCRRLIYPNFFLPTFLCHSFKISNTNTTLTLASNEKTNPFMQQIICWEYLSAVSFFFLRYKILNRALPLFDQPSRGPVHSQPVLSPYWAWPVVGLDPHKTSGRPICSLCSQVPSRYWQSPRACSEYLGGAVF